MQALELAADAEDAALAVGIAGAVRQEAVVDRGPDAKRLAQLAADHRADFLVAEVAVDDEHGVNLFGLELFNNLRYVCFAVHDVDRVDALKINESHFVGGEIFLDVLDDAMAALFSLFPVEDARTRGDVASHGRKTDFDLIVQHEKVPPVLWSVI